MYKDISIKELRNNLADIADRVEAGEAFRVIRRSKPSFILLHIEDEVPDERWQTVVDFTENNTNQGASIQDAIQAIDSMTE